MSALGGSIVPVLPFALLSIGPSVAAALVLGAVLLFALGAKRRPRSEGNFSFHIVLASMLARCSLTRTAAFGSCTKLS